MTWYQLSIQCSLEFHYYIRMASWSVSYMSFSISHKSHSSEILHTFDTFCNSSPKSFYETPKLNTDRFSRIYEKSVTLSLVRPNDRQINVSCTCTKFICDENGTVFISKVFGARSFLRWWTQGVWICNKSYVTYDRQNMFYAKWL